MKQSGLLRVYCILGFIFLYAPILSLIIFSFNESKLVTVWGGFSTKWYGELFRDPQILGAAWISFKVAFASATLAVILGTLAAYVLVRFGRFRGRALLTGMSTAPLVMPEVITGLSLLLLFVSMEQLIGWPRGRGMTTIIIAHVTFCLAYVAVVVQSRLAGLDQDLEEAAMDLGARPVRVFFDITIPVIAPALVAGWLLGLHAVARRSGGGELRDRAGGLDAADGHIFQGSPRRLARHQCAGDNHHRDRCGRRRARHLVPSPERAQWVTSGAIPRSGLRGTDRGCRR